MKWLMWTVVLVGTVWLLAGRAPQPSENFEAPGVTRKPIKGPEQILGPVHTTQAGGGKPDESPFASLGTAGDESLEPDPKDVINLGDPMDPDDPSTWSQPETTDVINLGDPMDPDDPSTWLQRETTEAINLGDPMDSDDPSTWSEPETTEAINLGDSMDPDAPWTWSQPETTEAINLGDPMDPDDPTTW